MKHIIYNIKLAIVLISLPLLSACNDFLEKEPKNNFNDEIYWTSESNVRVYSWKFYDQFLGYGKGVGYSSEFYFQAGGTAASINISDDLMANAFLQYEKNPSVSNTDWKNSFEFIRRANIMLARLPKVPGMTKAEADHWEGIAKFFRAMEYFKLVQRFGDVPYYDYEINSENINDIQKVFLPQLDRDKVMDKVFEDLDFAQNNLKTRSILKNENSAFANIEISKEAAWALIARAALFEGTFQKYHKGETTKANLWLQRAKEAANNLIGAGFTLSSTFKETYNSEDLSKSNDMILYKPYQLGILSNSIQAFNNTSTVINGMTKWAIDSYVCKDGLPISQSPLYKGDRSLDNILADRDGRLVDATETKDISYRGMKHRIPPLAGRASTSGYVFAIYNNPASVNVTTTGQNTIDAPVFTYAEALLNYAEACAELGNITNDDLNKSVNLLRARVGVAPLTVSGNVASASGTTINDPVRTSSLEKKTGEVSSIIWEVRRDRRAEFMGWTFMRYYDLMRWKKGPYLDFAANPQVNRGLYLGTIPEYINSKGEKVKEDITLDEDGYLVLYTRERTFNEERDYLNSIPTDQISLYEREGVTFKQNPKW